MKNKREKMFPILCDLIETKELFSSGEMADSYIVEAHEKAEKRCNDELGKSLDFCMKHYVTHAEYEEALMLAKSRWGTWE